LILSGSRRNKHQRQNHRSKKLQSQHDDSSTRRDDPQVPFKLGPSQQDSFSKMDRALLDLPGDKVQSAVARVKVLIVDALRYHYDLS
jgi:hypothetical protein